jgi:hypothetical protein
MSASISSIQFEFNLRSKTEMKRLNIGILLGACLLAGLSLAPHVVAKIAPTAQVQAALGNDEDTFTFAGECPNGEKYRLVSYEMDVSGIRQSFYDYEGPAGKGVVHTTASPKTMSVRVCRQLAEIINQNYWE